MLSREEFMQRALKIFSVLLLGYAVFHFVVSLLGVCASGRILAAVVQGNPTPAVFVVAHALAGEYIGMAGTGSIILFGSLALVRRTITDERFRFLPLNAIAAFVLLSAASLANVLSRHAIEQIFRYGGTFTFH